MSTPTRHPRTGSVAAPVALAVIGLAGLGAQPVVVSTLIEVAGFDVRAAGYIASAEVFGIALANAATTFGAARVSWRLLCGIGLALMLTGSALSLLAVTSPSPMMTARAVSGLGSGLLIARGYAAAGLTRDPDRMLGYILATSTAQIAIASYCLPMLAASWGVSVVFYYFAALAVIGVLFLKRIPVGADAAILSSHSGSSLTERVAALVAAAALFLGLGVLWAYLFQIGLAIGATTAEAAAGLTLSQVAAFVGALIAAFAVRWIPAIGLNLGSILVTIVSVALLQVLSGGIAYAVLASGFNGASNTTMVLALGAVAAADVDGRWIAAAVTLQTLGFAFGPAIAAEIVSSDGFRMAQFRCIALLVVSAAAAFAAFVLSRRRTGATGIASRPPPGPRHGDEF